MRQEIKFNKLFNNKNKKKWLKNFETNISNNTNFSINSKLESTNLKLMNYQITQTDKFDLLTPYYSKLNKFFAFFFSYNTTINKNLIIKIKN